MFRENRNFSIEIRSMKLKYEVLSDASKNYGYAKKYFKYNQIRRSKKRVVYVLQHIRFAIQIAKFGRITDLFVAREYHFKLINAKIESWEQFDAWSRPIMVKLFDQLR